MTCNRILVSLSAVAALSSLSQGAVVYSNFGPGDAFDVSVGHAVSGSTGFSASYQAMAMPFTTTGGGTLSSVEVAFGKVTGSSFLFQLCEDAGGDVGTPIYNWWQVVQPVFGSGEIVTLPASGVSLSPGTSYWLVADVLNQDDPDYGGWNQVSSLDLSTVLYRTGKNSPWQAMQNRPSAFRVTTVPEPASLAALSLGALGLLKRRKRAWPAFTN